MAVHPVDVAALIVGLIASASLSSIAYSDSDIGLTCTVPSHMTDAQTRYATEVCRSEAATWYIPFDDYIPKDDEPAKKSNVRPMYKPTSGVSILLLADSAIAIFCFILATSVFSNVNVKSGDSARKPIGWMIAYALAEGIAVVGWLALGIKSHLTFYGQDPVLSSVILCDYKVRILGSVQRYTIQCIVPKSNSVDFVLQANIAICFGLAVGMAGHVLLTLVTTVQAGMSKPPSAEHAQLQMEKQ